MRAAATGELTAHVIGALWWDRNRGLEQIDALIDQRAGGAAGRFAATSVKIMQDGVCENFTAAALTPYLDAHGAETRTIADIAAFLEQEKPNAAKRARAEADAGSEPPAAADRAKLKDFYTRRAQARET